MFFAHSTRSGNQFLRSPKLKLIYQSKQKLSFGSEKHKQTCFFARLALILHVIID